MKKELPSIVEIIFMHNCQFYKVKVDCNVQRAHAVNCLQYKWHINYYGCFYFIWSHMPGKAYRNLTNINILCCFNLPYLILYRAIITKDADNEEDADYGIECGDKSK